MQASQITLDRRLMGWLYVHTSQLWVSRIDRYRQDQINDLHRLERPNLSEGFRIVADTARREVMNLNRYGGDHGPRRDADERTLAPETDAREQEGLSGGFWRRVAA